MDLQDLFRISLDDKLIITTLRKHGVLKSHVLCHGCGEEMYTDYGAGTFRCQKTSWVFRQNRMIKKRCGSKVSIYSGSIIENFKVPLNKIFICMFLYVYNDYYTIKKLIIETKLTENTILKIVHGIQVVMARWYAEYLSISLGGEGMVVEIDEARFGGKKLRLGRLPKVKQWILGMKERVTGRIFLFKLPDRSARTLSSFVTKHVRPCTSVFTDCWRGYSGLARLGYRHHVVNHSVEHVNSIDGTHIQTIERTWRELRNLIPKYGVKSANIGEFLPKFVFNVGVETPDRVSTFLDFVGRQFGP